MANIVSTISISVYDAENDYEVRLEEHPEIPGLINVYEIAEDKEEPTLLATWTAQHAGGIAQGLLDISRRIDDARRRSLRADPTQN